MNANEKRMTRNYKENKYIRRNQSHSYRHQKTAEKYRTQTHHTPLQLTHIQTTQINKRREKRKEKRNQIKSIVSQMPDTSIGRRHNKLQIKQLCKSMKNCRKHKRLKSIIKHVSCSCERLTTTKSTPIQRQSITITFATNNSLKLQQD